MINHRSMIIGLIICINGMQITSKIWSNRVKKYKYISNKNNIARESKHYSMRRSLAMEAERRKALIHCVMDCLLSAER